MPRRRRLSSVMTIPGGHGSRPDPDEQELARAVDDSAALRQLLAAASAPPSSAELKGRSRAIAAFRAAHRRRRGATGGTPAASGTASKRTPLVRAGRWSAAQFTVVCAALVVLLGGTAVAAAAGQLPTALQDAVSDLFNGPDQPSPGPAPLPRPLPSGMHNLPPTPSGTESAVAPASSPAATSTATPGAGRPTAAQLAALCHAYRAAGADSRLLSAPGFAPLVDAAGSSAGVDGFCAGLAAPSSPATPSSRASSRSSASLSRPPSSSSPASPSGTTRAAGLGRPVTPAPDRSATAGSDQPEAVSDHPAASRGRSAAAHPQHDRPASARLWMNGTGHPAGH